MLLKNFPRASAVTAGVLLVGVALGAAASDKNDAHRMHEGHMMHGGDASMKMNAGSYPELKILLPHDGATVSSQLAVVFSTPGHMADLTMGAPTPGVHLHIDTQDVSLMPTMQQLVSLGGGNYLFLFDLPVKPGAHKINVYWSDAQHKTIQESVRSISVTVPAKR